MVDFANLRIAIETGDMMSAVQQLDLLAVEAEKAEKSTQKLGRATKQANDNIKKTTDGTRDLVVGFRRAATSVATLQGPLGGIAGRLNSIGTLLKQNGLALGVFALATAGVGAAFRNALLAGGKFEAQQAKIAAALRATGNASGVSARQIEEVSIAIGEQTLASTEAVRGAAAQLVTFSKITGDNFGRTLRLAQDVSTLGFGGLAEATKKLAKALSEPAVALGELREMGIRFTDSQKDLIESLVKTNRLAEAQEIIFKELEGRFGGVAEEAASGLLGALDTLGERLSRVFQSLGQSGGLSIATSSIKILADGVLILINNMDILSSALNGLVASLAALAAISAGKAAFAIGTQLVVALRAATTATAAFSAVLAANPIGLVAASLGVAVFAYSRYKSQISDVEKAQERFNDSIKATDEAVARVGGSSIENLKANVTQALKEIEIESAKIQKSIEDAQNQRQTLPRTRARGMQSSNLFKQITAEQKVLNEILQKREVILQKVAQKEEEAAAAQAQRLEQANKSIEEYLNKLKQENTLLAANQKERALLQAQIDLENFAKKENIDLTQETIDAVRSLVIENSAIIASQKAAKEAEKNREETLRQLKDVIDDTRTKTEQYNAEIMRLESLRGYAEQAEQAGTLSNAVDAINRSIANTTKEYNEAQVAVDDYIDALKQEIEALSLSADEREKLGRRMEFMKLLQDAEITNTEEYIKTLDDLVEKQQKLRSQGDTRTPFQGAQDGFKKYLEQTKSVASQVEDVVKRSFESMENAIQEFAISGKANFSDLVNSILTDIGKIVIRQNITAPLAAALQGALGTGLGGAFGGLFGGASAGAAAGGGTKFAVGGNFGGGTIQGGFRGFAKGGAFTVGGTGGMDSQFVAFKATPGERVTVRNGTYNGERSSSVNVSIVVNATDAQSFLQSKSQVQNAVYNAVRAGARNS